MAHVLVIRHSAFGDVVLSCPGFAAIRAHHQQDDITLLTTAPYAPLLRVSPWFDRVMIDSKPKWWDLAGVRRLRYQLSGFDKVYDMQSSGRTGYYFTLAGRPPWSGTARGCAYPAGPGRENLHTWERQAQQLHRAGVPMDLRGADLSWIQADISGFNLPSRYIVLVPGSSAHREVKRLPVETFHELVPFLNAPVVVVGAASEAPLAQEIGGIDLTGKSNFFQLASILRGAAFAIGNDTGPLHFAAALNVPCLALFSRESHPQTAAPRYPDGRRATVLQVPTLQELTVAQIRAHLP